MDRGIAGVHTDLPSMLMVIVGIVVFVASVGNVIGISERQAAEREIRADLRGISRDFMSSTLFGADGSLDVRTAAMTTNDDLEKELPRDVRWSVDVFFENGTFHWDSGDLTGDTYSVVLPVSVNVGTIVPGTVSVRIYT